MKTLLFGEKMYQDAKAGRKRITIRKFRREAHVFAEGEEFIGQFAEGDTLPLVATSDTLCKPAGELTDAEAKEDGFEDAADALEGLGRFYPDLSDETTLAIIRFDVRE